jgi:putative OPT family oligopeptide transporter
MTFVFTAANVYLGLRVGLTFATSIPAAVISMALLRGFKDAGIRENNIVQTVASAAGTLASIIFVLPGLIMIGWWQNFPYWLSFGVCATGGILGVMFSIPLRRAMVVGSDLPYPEGVAAAEVLKVGVGSREGAAESRRGLRMISLGTIASAGFAALTAAKVFAEEVGGYFRVGNAATGLSTGFSLALLGAGHLVGLSVGIAMFVGLAFAWVIATPIISAMHPAAGEAAGAALGAWRQVRFIGAGSIGVGALWKLAQLIGPIYQGIVTSLKASRSRSAATALPREEQDIPVRTMGVVSAVMLVPIAALLIAFLQGGKLASLSAPLVIGGLIYVVIIGAFVAAVCGYMAGLIGASNSPVSGVG